MTLEEKKKRVAEKQRRHQKLENLKKFDNDTNMKILASAKGTQPVLARIVSVNFRDQKWKTTRERFSIHLSCLAAGNIDKYFEILENIGVPYKIQFGNFYLLKLATPEEISNCVLDRKESLEQLHEAIKQGGDKNKED